MKKSSKIIIIILLTMVFLFISIETIDIFRLKKSVGLQKPFITISEINKSNRVTYNSLIFSVSYYVNTEEKYLSDDVVHVKQTVYGAEARVFKKILIWAWVS